MKQEGEILTQMQVKTLRQLARMGNVIDTAEALGLSTRTAHWHLDHAYKALGVNRAEDAISIARSKGLIPSEEF